MFDAHRKNLVTARKPYLIAACIWLAMVAVFFSPALFQGKVLAPLDIMDSLLRPWAASEKIDVHNAYAYDAISQYLPYDYSIYQSLQHDGYIGWNPYTHSGTSVVENTMSCPGDWHHHLYRFLPFWPAWNTGIILQFTLAGLGMLLMLRDRKIPAAFALIGVVAFGFYSQFTLWIYHGWILGAMCWAPWILWALHRARLAGRIIDLPSIAFIALAFRGGHLQSCIFVVLLVGLVALSDWWKSSDRPWRAEHVFKTFLPYAVYGIFGAVLALDVIIETVPALLEGKRDMPSRSWVETLTALPTLATSFFPTILGTPQGLDLTRTFKADLFTIKFLGAVPLLLASFACFRRQAPAAAKTLFIVGLVLPFTPADQWLYSRFTVVFAIGAAWLAAWHLTTISQEAPSKIWKRALLALSLIIGIWLLGSVAISVKQTWLENKVHEIIIAKLPEGKANRMNWMLARSDHFLKESLIWFPRNLAMLAMIGLGIFACSRIHNQNPNASRFALLAAICAFGEIALFNSTWITFSPQPKGDGLYDEPAWATRLKQEAGEGSILCYDRSDFDFMQLNTPSAYGIRFAEGYETVTPHRIDPYAEEMLDPQHCAQSGISHLLVPPTKDPGKIQGWEKSYDSKEFVLYRNPAFQGICFAHTSDGETIPLSPAFKTPNQRQIDLPANAESVTLLESYNPGWKFSTQPDSWKPVLETEIHAMRMDLDRTTTDGNSHLVLRYRPAYQSTYRPIIGITLAGLVGLTLFRCYRARRT